MRFDQKENSGQITHNRKSNLRLSIANRLEIITVQRVLLAVPVDCNDSAQGFKWDGNATRGEEMFSATIKFVHGDAANHNDMKEIMAKQSFDVAVVLGTQVMGAGAIGPFVSSDGLGPGSLAAP